MSSRQALCLMRSGGRYLLPRQFARRLVPMMGEAVLVGRGLSLVSVEGLPVLLVEPAQLLATPSAMDQDVTAMAEPQPFARFALLVEASGDVSWAVAADEVGPADEGDQDAPWLDLTKGLTDVE